MAGTYKFIEKQKQILNYTKITHSISKSKNPYDIQQIKQKMATNFKKECSDLDCKFIENSKNNDIQNKSNCKCRKNLIECNENCACNKKSENCFNRGLKNCFNNENLLSNSLSNCQNNNKIREVFLRGIDPFCRQEIKRNLCSELSEKHKEYFINELVLKTLTKNCIYLKNDTSLLFCLKQITKLCDEHLKSDDCKSDIFDLCCFKKSSRKIFDFAKNNPKTMQSYSKGIGVIVKEGFSFEKGELIGEYTGELYSSWLWQEKEFCSKNLLNKLSETSQKTRLKLPEFYNMILERHKNDPLGYDLVVVDAIRKGSFASRLSHSCDSNATVVPVVAHNFYRIAVFAKRRIESLEEIAFDYFCRTDSKNELKEAVCLCGSINCRGSFLIYSEDYSNIIFKKKHTILHRIAILLSASFESELSSEEKNILNSNHFKSLILQNLPIWALKFTAKILEFIEFENSKITRKIYNKMSKKTLNKKKWQFFLKNQSFDDNYFFSLEEANIIKNKRLQSLTCTLDKLHHFFQHKSQPKHAPLRLLSTEEIIAVLFSSQNSIFNLHRAAIRPHFEPKIMTKIDFFAENHLKNSKNCEKNEKNEKICEKIQKMEKMEKIAKNFEKIQKIQKMENFEKTAKNIEKTSKISKKTAKITKNNKKHQKITLSKIRQILRQTAKLTNFSHNSKSAQNKAAADILKLYSMTKLFFKAQKYIPFKSETLYTALNSKSSPAKFAAEFKIYGADYPLALLLNWHKEGDESWQSLMGEIKGVLILPDLTSCYSAFKGEPSVVEYREENRRFIFGENFEFDENSEKIELKCSKFPLKGNFEYTNELGVFGTPFFDKFLNEIDSKNE